MRLLRRSLAYATIGAGLAGLTSVVLYGPDEVKRKVTSTGLVRVGRAARAVSRYIYNHSVLHSCVKNLNQNIS